MKIIADANIPFVREYFGNFGTLKLMHGRAIRHENVKDADILLVRSITPINADLLENTRVKFVGSLTAGADHLDIPFLKQAGIDWSTAPGYNAPPVADYVISTIAGLQLTNRLQKSKLRVAIIGVGEVGARVAEFFKVLGAEILLCDPPRAKRDRHFKSCQLAAINACDVISLHVPLITDGDYPTLHMIEKDFLMRQQADCVLINTSRGAVIKEEDLLSHGKHLQWCFDVWDREPRINPQVLAHAQIATPHIAGYSKQSKIRGINMLYQLACTKKIFPKQALQPFALPKQTLALTNEKQNWQTVVLSIFNPLLMSVVMKTLLTQSEDIGKAFDDMRQQFDYRHELAFTEIDSMQLPPEDQILLRKIHMQLLHRN